MDERKASALLKARFEAAGFHIEENRELVEAGIRFDVDGFDPERRVGYEYVTREAGDDWDVDAGVIAALDELRRRGELFVLVVDEHDAPDEATLGRVADAFLAGLAKPAKAASKPKAKAPGVKAKAKPKAAAKKPAKRS